MSYGNPSIPNLSSLAKSPHPHHPCFKKTATHVFLNRSPPRLRRGIFFMYPLGIFAIHDVPRLTFYFPLSTFFYLFTNLKTKPIKFMEQTPLQTSSTSSGPAPKNWLVESILATLLCCFIPGIVAIVFATQVNTKWVNGDLEGSRKASKDAGLWTKISFFLGIAF